MAPTQVFRARIEEIVWKVLGLPARVKNVANASVVHRQDASSVRLALTFEIKVKPVKMNDVVFFFLLLVVFWGLLLH